jgi:diaminopimelate epimerase
MTGLPFIKMHGLGNDFVVLDGRKHAFELTRARIRAIADRRTGVGCDQLIVVGPAKDKAAQARMAIFNADGGPVEACGNATRCVAALIMAETGKKTAAIQTPVGVLAAQSVGPGTIAVDMGEAKSNWREIPLAQAADTLRLDLIVGPLSEPTAVNMGNPHAVFFVDDAEAVHLEELGPVIETHPMFPKRTNVEVAEVIGPQRIRMRVWERGVGITRACGTGACATVVAAHRRGFTERAAEVVLDGGTLAIEWLDNGHVRMTGPVTAAFRGVIEKNLLDQG